MADKLSGAAELDGSQNSWGIHRSVSWKQSRWFRFSVAAIGTKGVVSDLDHGMTRVEKSIE